MWTPKGDRVLQQNYQILSHDNRHRQEKLRLPGTLYPGRVQCTRYRVAEEKCAWEIFVPRTMTPVPGSRVFSGTFQSKQAYRGAGFCVASTFHAHRAKHRVDPLKSGKVFRPVIKLSRNS
eukprot:3681550-Rhodomonas_salina.2